MTRANGRTFLTVLIVLLTSITWGCSMLIARSGVPHRGALYGFQTRAEVRDQFGEADETCTCPEGRVVERRWIRQQVDWMCTRPSGFADEMGCAMLEGAYRGSVGLVDIFVLPVIEYRSQQAKLHYAFVYDEADQVLYRYDLAAPAPEQFDEVTRPLGDALYGQLADGKCDTWTACLTDYVQEARQRATCLRYALSREEEQAFERMLAIGEGVDAGRIPREAALADLEETYRVRRPP